VVDPIQNTKRSSSRFVRGLWTAAGTISLGLGILGIILPLLPTTPFLLLAAFCYLKGSERMHNWLMNHRVFGKYIRDYMEGRGIPLKTKVIAISFIWITISITVLFFIDLLLIRILLIGIATAVTIYLVRFKTLKE
jgi:uncharacterized membrane protein YbaN (DUF454 family)